MDGGLHTDAYYVVKHFGFAYKIYDFFNSVSLYNSTASKSFS